mgnify:CR=1 FL=1
MNISKARQNRCRKSSNPKDIYRVNSEEFKELLRRNCAELKAKERNEIISRIKPQDRQEDRKGNYSSAHLLFFANSYNLGSVIQVPLEIQVRTAIEDIWSEINHKRVYKITSQYLWTEKFNLAILEADEKSSGIKQDFDAISQVIEAISDNSRTALYHLEDFWNHSQSLTAPGGPEGKNAKAAQTKFCFLILINI